MVPYTLLLSVVEYKTLVLRGDMETAADVLETIPQAGCWALAVEQGAPCSSGLLLGRWGGLGWALMCR